MSSTTEIILPSIFLDGTMFRERAVPRPPPTELGRIALKIPTLFQRTNEYICAKAPINFIGSMLLEAELRRSDRHENNSSAITLVHDVKIFIEETGTGLVMQDVLIKNACGRRDVGVVLNGAYAGLLLDRVFVSADEEGMRVAKVWNDDLIRQGDGPNGPAPRLIDSSFLPEFYDRFHELVQAKRQESGRAYTIDLFFDLCRQLGLPLDEETFFYTRTP